MKQPLEHLLSPPTDKVSAQHSALRSPPTSPAQTGVRLTLAFSISDFCLSHGISRAHFYNLSKSGDAPTIMRVGRRTLISAEAAAEWRRRMEEDKYDPRNIRYLRP